jgi:hypothetical protein
MEAAFALALRTPVCALAAALVVAACPAPAEAAGACSVLNHTISGVAI